MDVAYEPSEILGKYIEDLNVGDQAVFAKTITEADIVLFSGVTGDMNPIHVDEEYAKTTQFKGRIAHGMLTASLISTVLGMKMPGPGCIYISQNLKFLAPVMAGDTVTARAQITSINLERKRIICSTNAFVGAVKVIEGEAEMKVPSKHKKPRTP
ncbi:MAG: MaoC family dehydratase [Alphaproteobacteria bacterium]